ncbi:MAG: hypothetical protein H7096_10000 [Flavobacterium sp.]|nr:hypothetical protein [Pedobacter sp.]
MRLLIILCFCLVFISCSVKVKKVDLLGVWDYVQIENLNRQSEDSTTVQDLELAKPYIEFKSNNQVQIVWNGSVLSSGTYRTDKNMIRYRENLPEGKIREFPFLVSRLSATKIIFETMTREGTRVTAIKRK